MPIVQYSKGIRTEHIAYWKIAALFSLIILAASILSGEIVISVIFLFISCMTIYGASRCQTMLKLAKANEHLIPDEASAFQKYIFEMRDRQHRINEAIKGLPASMSESTKQVPGQVDRLITMSQRVLSRAAKMQMWLAGIHVPYFEIERSRLSDQIMRTSDPVTLGHYKAAIASIDESLNALKKMSNMVERAEAQCTHVRHSLAACYIKIMELQQSPQTSSLEPSHISEELENLHTNLHSVEDSLTELFDQTYSLATISRELN